MIKKTILILADQVLMTNTFLAHTMNCVLLMCIANSSLQQPVSGVMMLIREVLLRMVVLMQLIWIISRYPRAIAIPMDYG